VCCSLLMLTASWGIKWKPKWWNKVGGAIERWVTLCCLKYNVAKRENACWEAWVKNPSDESLCYENKLRNRITSHETSAKSRLAAKWNNVTKPERSQSGPDLRGSPGSTVTQTDSADFIQTFASLNSWNVNLYFQFKRIPVTGIGDP
jgi:hypothetical protein